MMQSSVTLQVDAVLFVVLGSLADYGNIARWVLLLMTIILWAFQFATMALVREWCRFVNRKSTSIDVDFFRSISMACGNGNLDR
jgi:MFS-type transporter involved in bile tolerance (Atg22 family)